MWPEHWDRKAHRAAEFIDQLPRGYDTTRGRMFEGGHQLSGGQWQKVALARAFMRQAPLVILDEPTAAIDAEAEAEIFGRLREIAHNATALLIAHRFSTVRLQATGYLEGVETSEPGGVARGGARRAKHAWSPRENGNGAGGPVNGGRPRHARDEPAGEMWPYRTTAGDRWWYDR